MGIAAKIGTLLGVFLLVLVGTTAYSLVQMAGLQGRLRELGEQTAPLRIALEKIMAARQDQIIHTERILRLSKEGVQKPELKEVQKKAEQEIEAAWNIVETEARNADAIIAGAIKQAPNEESAAKLEKIGQSCKDLYPKRAEYRRSVENLLSNLRQGKSAEAEALVPEVDKLSDRSNAANQAVREEIIKFMAESMSEARMEQQSTIRGVLIIGILGLLVSVGWSFLIVRNITIPLRNLLSLSSQISQGNLSVPELNETRDEVGQLCASFNKMKKSLRDLLAHSVQLTTEVGAAARQIGTAAQQQVSSLAQANTSVGEISTTSEEFKTTIQEFTDRARAVGEAAAETAKRTSEGRELTQASSTKVSQIRTNAEGAGESVLNLSEHMQRISEITTAVKEIAEQTKLLALNASIEAARAGEEGRGFAVVATQVRELANQSREASERIATVIADGQRAMQVVVTKIEEGNRLSDECNELIQKTSQRFNEIAGAVDQTSQAMKQIAVTAQQQQTGIAEVVTSLNEIKGGSEESVASAQQSQKAVLKLEERARELNDAMAKFKTA